MKSPAHAIVYINWNYEKTLVLNKTRVLVHSVQTETAYFCDLQLDLENDRYSLEKQKKKGKIVLWIWVPSAFDKCGSVCVSACPECFAYCA